MDNRSTTRAHLHLDGLAVLVFSVVAFAILDGSWGLFAALLFAPDLFMLGYLANPRLGAALYNAGHSLFWPVILAALGLLTQSSAGDSATGMFHLGLIWSAHIGMDRAAGFGYKYPTHFKDTDIARA